MPTHTYWKHRPLGHGGGGTVYEGRSRFGLGTHQRQCAVKLMHESMVDDTSALARFSREAIVGYELIGHPHLVGTRSFGVSATGQPYLVMELTGPTLRDLGARLHGRIPVIWRVAEAGVRGLLALQQHDRGHGDLNTGNIFLGLDGRIKLGDFGNSMVPADDRRKLALVLAWLTIGRMPTDRRGLVRPLPDHVPEDLRTLISGLISHEFSLEQADGFIQAQRAQFAPLATTEELARTWVEDCRVLGYQDRRADEHTEVHCHDLYRPKMSVSGICRPSALGCEQNRMDLIKRKIGKPGPCETQPTAFCFLMYKPSSMTRQRECARTMDNCQARLQWVNDDLDTKTILVGECSALRNIEWFAFEDEVPLDQLPPPSATP